MILSKENLKQKGSFIRGMVQENLSIGNQDTAYGWGIALPDNFAKCQNV